MCNMAGCRVSRKLLIDIFVFDYKMTSCWKNGNYNDGFYTSEETNGIFHRYAYHVANNKYYVPSLGIEAENLKLKQVDHEKIAKVLEVCYTGIIIEQVSHNVYKIKMIDKPYEIITVHRDSTYIHERECYKNLNPMLHVYNKTIVLGQKVLMIPNNTRKWLNSQYIYLWIPDDFHDNI